MLSTARWHARAIFFAQEPQGGCGCLLVLTLRSNGFGAAGAQALAAAFAQQPPQRAGCWLQIVDVSHNSIGDAGLEHLSDALLRQGACPSLLALDVTENQASEAAVAAVRQAFWRRLPDLELTV